MNRLDGKVALITGGGAGIGRASALLFAQEGARVVIAERDADAGEETVELITAQSAGQATFIQTDVAAAESVASAVEQTVAEHGRFDVLYNNAGGSSTLYQSSPAHQLLKERIQGLVGHLVVLDYEV